LKTITTVTLFLEHFQRHRREKYLLRVFRTTP
jgi:hypothetical protein